MDETGDADVIDVGRLAAPWGKELLVQALHYPSGLRLARVRIREGHRFTLLDLDDASAAWLVEMLQKALPSGQPPHAAS